MTRTVIFTATYPQNLDSIWHLVGPQVITERTNKAYQNNMHRKYWKKHTKVLMISSVKIRMLLIFLSTFFLV